MYYTDFYLRRCYHLLEKRLSPDTILFLGDLFDGGREWATTKSESPEARYKRIGDSFWHQEYARFGDIFFHPKTGRKIVADLPGNHDLGIGSGIQLPVRKRFNAYFGEGNRVDVIANHTFVLVDTVSLSAMDQPDPVTGSQGLGAGDGDLPYDHIWGPPKEFLDTLRKQKTKAVDRELRRLHGEDDGVRREHEVYDANSTRGEGEELVSNSSELPTVLLTHVPLYRAPGTPCGPLREHWPPSSDPPPDKDDANAIRVAGGYQYQNVLTPQISSDLITKAGGVQYVFSGDDHDYCEVVHREFSGLVREITVKSMSWAMGVRKPGFLMVSIWNPIDALGNPLGALGGGHGRLEADGIGAPTLETHLCLLPDQLAIFIRYAVLLGISLAVLSIRAVVVVFRPSHSSSNKDDDSENLLPSHRLNGRARAQSNLDSHKIHDSVSSTSTSNGNNPTHLAPRSAASRTRSVSPGYAYTPPVDGQPLINMAGNFAPSNKGYSDRDPDPEPDDWWEGVVFKPKPKTKIKQLKDELLWSVLRVGGPIFSFYFVVLWYG